MNNNFYGNYGNGGFNGYGYNPYQQPYAAQPQNQNFQNGQQQVQQPAIFNLFKVNGIEGAKAFIVNINQTVYLQDNDSNTLFIKSCDRAGNITIKAFETKPIELDKVGKPVEKSSTIDTSNFASKEDLKNLEMSFSNTINNLVNEFHNSLGFKPNYENQKRNNVNVKGRN